MAKKKVDLAKAMAQREEPEAPVVEEIKAPLTGKAKAKGRDGMVNIAGFFQPSVKFTLDELRLKRQRELGRRVTVQEIMGEAYNDLFKKYGFPEVAPTKD